MVRRVSPGGAGGGGLPLPEAHSAPPTSRSPRPTETTPPTAKPKSWLDPAGSEMQPRGASSPHGASRARRALAGSSGGAKQGEGRDGGSPLPPPPPPGVSVRPASQRGKSRRVGSGSAAHGSPAATRDARPRAGERWGYKQRPGHIDRFLNDGDGAGALALAEVVAGSAQGTPAAGDGEPIMTSAMGLGANGPIAARGASHAARRALEHAMSLDERSDAVAQQAPALIDASDAMAAVAAVARERDGAIAEMDALARELEVLRVANARLEAESAMIAQQHAVAMRDAVAHARHEAITASVNAAADAAGEAATRAYRAGEEAQSAPPRAGLDGSIEVGQQHLPQVQGQEKQAEPPSEEILRLRDKVQSALDELNRIEAQRRATDLEDASEARASGSALRGGTDTTIAVGDFVASAGASAGSLVHLKDHQLQERLAMSQSIMRKLYRKNVELEKELRLARGGEGAGAGATVDGSEALPIDADVPTVPEVLADSPAMAALRSRDATITQLREALESQQRRSAALESIVSEAGGEVGDSLRQALAEGATHSTRYKALRGEYRRLLERRVEVVRKTGGMSTEARALVDDLRARLRQESVERESEAAMSQAKLNEREQQSANWYVERELLGDRIDKLVSEVRERDMLDAKIEMCVCGLFERMDALERSNEGLCAQLKQTGIVAAMVPAESPI